MNLLFGGQGGGDGEIELVGMIIKAGQDLPFASSALSLTPYTAPMVLIEVYHRYCCPFSVREPEAILLVASLNASSYTGGEVILVRTCVVPRALDEDPRRRRSDDDNQ